MTTTSKRPEQLAWASLITSLVFFGIAFFLGRWSGFTAISAVSWQILGAALIWFVLAVQFHQRSLAEQEKLDMGQLAQEHSGATIFQGRGEQAALLAAAQRRLELLEKWFVPIFAVLIAAYEIGIGIYLLKSLGAPGDAQTQQPLVCAIIMTAVAFVSFLLSRYATGMSAEPAWKPLRAGGSYVLGIALACFALALGLAAVHFHYRSPVLAIGYVVAGLVALLGAETAVNALFDIYRPRLRDQYNRSAFDSRLLGIINEPGGIFHSAASAIDYQFGFQVSQTWFYKLLEKAIVPLILFSAATLYLASTLVVVGPNEQAIVEHFGNPLHADGTTRIIDSGLHFKWPWPIDIAYTHPTRQIREIHVGYVPKTDPTTGRIIPATSLLWGEAHYEQEYSVLVASESAASTSGDAAVPVNLIKANIPVQYRVKDLYSYIYKHRDPGKLLEDICYRELNAVRGRGQDRGRRELRERRAARRRPQSGPGHAPAEDSGRRGSGRARRRGRLPRFAGNPSAAGGGGGLRGGHRRGPGKADEDPGGGSPAEPVPRHAHRLRRHGQRAVWPGPAVSGRGERGPGGRSGAHG